MRRRRHHLWLALPLLGFAALTLLLWRGLSNDPTLLPSALLNRPLPEFRIARLDDPTEWLGADALKGEAALLNVWATWCPTCRAEHAFLNRLKAQGVVIYGINYKDDRESALRWLAELGDPYRFSLDDRSGQLGIELGVYGAPETFLLDAEGIIRFRHVGAVDAAVWQQAFVPRLRALAADQ